MATVKELVTRFGFEVDDAGLKKIEDGISSAKDGLLGLGVVIGGAAAGLYGFLRTAANAGDALKVQSDQLGITVEAIQRFQLAAKLSNVSAEEFTQGMTLLSRNIANAKNGSGELQAAFRKVGISGAQLRSGTLKTDQVFQQISKTLDKMPDGPEKVALSMELFGRSGAKMIGVVKTLNEGFDPLTEKVLQMSTITREQAEAGDAFNDSLEVMELALTSIARMVGFDLIPAAKEIVEQISRWVVENKELIKSNVGGFVKGLATGLRAAIRFADILIKALSGLAQGIGGVETATKGLLLLITVLSGASVLIGIGKLTQAVVLLGNSFTAASLKAAAIPLLIGAAMVALFLIMEDIYSFFQGKDSFLGDLLKAIPEVGDTFKQIFEPIFEPFVNLMTMLTDGFSSWENIFRTLGTIIINTLLLPMRAFVATIAGVSGLIGRLTGNATLQNFAAGASAFGSNLKVTDDNPILGVSPGLAVSSAPGAGGNQTANDLQVTNQFNFPPGTDPTRVEGPISSGVSSGIDDILRQTQRSTSAGGAY